MQSIENLISPELLITVPVLYLFGMGLKKLNVFNDKFIPMTLGAVGVILSFLKLMAENPLTPELIFAALTQGILCAGSAVYANQLIKQGSIKK